jgi:hypothetical protein
MRVLGIDPGLHNCGVCVYETTTQHIQAWEVIDTDPSSAKGMTASLDEALDRVLRMGDIDGVAVERQPPKNAQMLKCMYYIESYAAYRFPKAWYVTITPQKRHALTRPGGVPVPSTYAARKKRSIEYVVAWLASTDNNSEAQKILAAHAKKDDLCEAFLVALIAASQRRDQE